MRQDQFDHMLKILLVGDSGVGKSSILVRFTDNTFDTDVPSTIGVDFKVKFLEIDGKRIKVTIWDTAGQERFRTLTSSYYRGAQGVVLVYDVGSRESFDNIRTWLQEVNTYTTHSDVIKLLVGNKIDRSEREVSRGAAETFARANNMLFIECSAKTKTGIQQAFEEAVRKILDTPSLLAHTGPTARAGSTKLTTEAPPPSACAC